MKKMDKHISLSLSAFLISLLLAACAAQRTPTATPGSQSTLPLSTVEASMPTPGLTGEVSPTPQPQTPTSTPTSMPTLSPTPLPPTATPTLVPPSPTPTSTPAPAVERILFSPGATQATVEGYLPAGDSKVYVMHMAAGQYLAMDATVGATGQGLRFSVVGANGVVVKAMGEAHVRTVVPYTQDYYVELVSDVGTVSYQMSVLIPVRIRFAPGSISAEVEGSLAAGDVRHYVLYVLAGQQMIVDPYTTQGRVRLIIWGADGQVLLSGRVGPPGGNFGGVLPVSQDYLIAVQADGGADATYDVDITIPPM